MNIIFNLSNYNSNLIKTIYLGKWWVTLETSCSSFLGEALKGSRCPPLIILRGVLLRTSVRSLLELQRDGGTGPEGPRKILGRPLITLTFGRDF
jgi:hypothetical protein